MVKADTTTIVTYRVYNSSNSPINATTTDNLTCLKVDHQNTIWAGAKSGNQLVHFNKITGTWQVTNISVLGNNVWGVLDIDFDSNNNMWIGTNNGIFNLTNTGVWTSYFNLSNPPYQSWIRVVHIDKFNNVWCVNNGDLYKYDNQAWTHLAVFDSLFNYQVQKITSDSLGNLWIGCYGALIKYDGINFVKLDNPLENTTMNIFDINVLSSNNLWIGTLGGLHNLVNMTWNTVDTTPIVNPLWDDHNWTVSSIVTNNTIKLFGTWNTGLAIFDNQIFNFMRGSEFNIDTNKFQVNKLTFDNDGNLWIATRFGQVIVYNKTGLK